MFSMFSAKGLVNWTVDGKVFDIYYQSSIKNSMEIKIFQRYLVLYTLKINKHKQLLFYVYVM